MSKNNQERYLKVKTVLPALFVLSQTGCIAVGYSSGGGWFVWPGGLGLILVLVLLFFLFGRRGR